MNWSKHNQKLLEKTREEDEMWAIWAQAFFSLAHNPTVNTEQTNDNISLSPDL